MMKTKIRQNLLPYEDLRLNESSYNPSGKAKSKIQKRKSKSENPKAKSEIFFRVAEPVKIQFFLLIIFQLLLLTIIIITLLFF